MDNTVETPVNPNQYLEQPNLKKENDEKTIDGADVRRGFDSRGEEKSESGPVPGREHAGIRQPGSYFLPVRRRENSAVNEYPW